MNNSCNHSCTPSATCNLQQTHHEVSSNCNVSIADLVASQELELLQSPSQGLQCRAECLKLGRLVF